jgi:heme-degrading monooxygenase HmoA
VIARIWRGEVPTEKADAYFQLMHDVALPDYQATPGNIGAYALRREPGSGGDGVTEVVMLSFWESLDTIEAFAGADPEVAKYYDFDDDFLLSKPRLVEHYSATGGPPKAATPDR